MILVDYQISDLCDRGLINPCDRSLINPASLDVRIGESAIVEYEFGDKQASFWGEASQGDKRVEGFLPFSPPQNVAPEWANLNLTQYTSEAPYWLQPKEFLLVGTAETVAIPENISAEFRLKSSRAREGWDQCLAIWLDPGFCGVITLELINQCRYTRLPLYPGLLIGQLIFHTCEVPDRPYSVTGRYQGARSVEASKG